jgi:hypothetical protein
MRCLSTLRQIILGKGFRGAILSDLQAAPQRCGLRENIRGSFTHLLDREVTLHHRRQCHPMPGLLQT